MSNTIQKSSKPAKAGKQLVVQVTISPNSGFQEAVETIKQNPENYQIPNSKFDLSSKSSIYSQAVEIGLQYMIDHPKTAPQNSATNKQSQAIAQSLFPLIDARLKTLFEMSVSNYLNNKSTNLYTKNILLALKAKFGSDITSVSINKLNDEINKNIEYIIDYEKKLLLKSFEEDKILKDNEKKSEE